MCEELYKHLAKLSRRSVTIVYDETLLDYLDGGLYLSTLDAE